MFPANPRVHLRDAQFEPTSQKWSGHPCKGVQLHILERRAVRSLDLSNALVRAAIELGEAKFAWKDPHYDYDYKTLPMKLIYGFKKTDDKFTVSRFSITDPFWHQGIELHIKRTSDFLIYPRQVKGPR